MSALGDVIVGRHV